FKGLNTRDGFTALEPDEAYALQNWLPQSGSCTVRPGYTGFATISGSKPVKTLASVPIGGAVSLLAASNGGLFHVISGSPSTLVAASTSASDYWSTAFQNGFLFGVNGGDTPFRYDGTTVTGTGFSGVTLTSLNTINAVNFRLWATVNNSGDAYYGGL